MAGRNRCCLAGLPRSPKGEEFQEEKDERVRKRRGEGNRQDNFTEGELSRQTEKVYSQVEGRCANCRNCCAKRKGGGG